MPMRPSSPFPDASPAKWHLAHTTWFFETFVLRDHVPGYEAFDDRFAFLFNSYYEAEGDRHERPKRGMLSRPTLDEVRDWRASVDEALDRALPGLPPEALDLVELGINHEQQHQELLCTDILATFAENPLEPAYAELGPPTCYATEKLSFHPGRTGTGRDRREEREFRFRLRTPAAPRISPPAFPCEPEGHQRRMGRVHRRRRLFDSRPSG